MVYQDGCELFPNDVYCGDKFQCERYPGNVFTVTDSMQSNNGNFRAVDQNGKLVWFNTVSDDIDIIERTTTTRDNREEWTEFKRRYDKQIRDRQRKALRKIVASAPAMPIRFMTDEDMDALDCTEGRCLPNDTDL